MSKNSPEKTARQKLKMLEAIEANYGNISKAAEAIKIKTSTHYRWLKEDRQYAEMSESMRDISFRKIKDKLLEKALTKIDEGSTSILNRMLGIYMKNIPLDMQAISRENNVPIRVGIKYVSSRKEVFPDEAD